MTDLEFLSIRCNLVTDISALGNLTNLETLYLGRDTQGSSIKKYLCRNLTKLRNLYAAGCGITDIKALEPIVSNLQALDLTENSITDFSLLQENILITRRG
ncbi:MAG: leucine-rich repeat domain-containing protein [Lachnospira eligens]